MTTSYIGYGYGRASRAERRAIARRDRTVARFWHHRLTRDRYEYGYERETSATMGPWRPAGHLGTPCSRYGADADECAWWAVALAFVVDEANGDGLTADNLDSAMSLAVNDHDDVADLVAEGWYAVPPYVRAHLGTLRDVRALVA